MPRYLILSIILILAVLRLDATGTTLDEQPKQKGKHPSVFLIGENSNAFEELSLEYEKNLITVCDNDMDFAYQKWQNMLCDIETYADEKGFDIKGVKTWIKFFWSADGSLDHIAYHLHPRSVNISTKELSKFFADFVKNYQFAVESDKVFSHYASAAFPNYYCKTNSK